MSSSAVLLEKSSELPTEDRGGIRLEMDDARHLHFFDGLADNDLTALIAAAGSGFSLSLYNQLSGGSAIAQRSELGVDGTLLTLTDDGSGRSLLQASGLAKLSGNNTLVGNNTLTGNSTLGNTTGGTPALVVEKTQASAGAYSLIGLTRNGASKGTIGLDANDNLLLSPVSTLSAIVGNVTGGTPGLLVEKTQASAGVYALLGLTRNGTSKGTVGLDASDNLLLSPVSTLSAIVGNVTGGTAALVVEKTQASAGVYTLLGLTRNGTQKGAIGLDASDNLTISPSSTLSAIVGNTTGGTAALLVEKTQASAGVYTLIGITRNGTAKGTIGLDASDNLLLSPVSTLSALIGNTTGGTAGLIVEKTQASAGAYTLIGLTRNGTSKGTVGLDASDNLLLTPVSSLSVLVGNVTAGTAGLIVEKTQASAGAYTLVGLTRNGTSKGKLALDASDNTLLQSVGAGVKILGNAGTSAQFTVSDSAGIVAQYASTVIFTVDANNITLNAQTATTSALQLQSYQQLHTQFAKTGAINPASTWTTGAHSSISIGTNVIDFDFGSATARTISWLNTGAPSHVAEVTLALFRQTTLNFANNTGTPHFTQAATVAIVGAPIAGANAVINEGMAFWVKAGRTRLDGDLVMGSAGGKFGIFNATPVTQFAAFSINGGAQAASTSLGAAASASYVQAEAQNTQAVLRQVLNILGATQGGFGFSA